jgi:hypothetical protein
MRDRIAEKHRDRKATEYIRKEPAAPASAPCQEGWGKRS